MLADGTIISTWRPRKNSRKLTITVKTFGTLPSRHKTAVQNEAEQIGPLRSASSVVVEFETY